MLVASIPLIEPTLNFVTNKVYQTLNIPTYSEYSSGILILRLCTVLGARIAQWHSTRLRADDRGFESRQGLGTSLFTTVSRAALKPTQPPI
jgi:hypothetical protein